MAFQDRVGMHYAGFRKDTADIGIDEQEKIRKNPAIKNMNKLTAMAGGATTMIEMAKKFQGPQMEAKGKYKKWFINIYSIISLQKKKKSKFKTGLKF